MATRSEIHVLDLKGGAIRCRGLDEEDPSKNEDGNLVTSSKVTIKEFKNKKKRWRFVSSY